MIRASAALLAVVAIAGCGGGGPPSPPQGVGDDTVSRNGIRLAVATGWSPRTRPSKLPGMPFSQPLALEQRAFGWQLDAELLPARTPTLLPPSLSARIHGMLPRPARTRVARGAAYEYRKLPVRGARSDVHVFVAPTTAGVATVACTSTRNVPVALRECEQMVSSLDVPRGRPLPLEDAAYELGLPRVIDALDAVRVPRRERLRRARTRSGQASTAALLADAYGAAAGQLAALEHPDRPQAATRLCRDLRRAYDALEAAALAGNSAGWRSARSTVAGLEARLADAIG